MNLRLRNGGPEAEEPAGRRDREDSGGLTRVDRSRMTLTPTCRLPSDGDASLEIRWIIEGCVPRAMIDWLGPPTGQIEERGDSYLVGLTGPGVGVKIRGGAQLDVKVYAGSPGTLTVPGRAEGALQWWRKWSYPLPGGGDEAAREGWSNIWKVRRIRLFSVEGRPLAQIDRAGQQGACAIELTEVAFQQRPWWTLGFEATGPSSALLGAIDASAAYMFARPLPAGLRLQTARATSYPEWLATNYTAVVNGRPESVPDSTSWPQEAVYHRRVT